MNEVKDYDAKRRENEGKFREFSLAGETFVAKPIMGADAISDLADIETGQIQGGVYEKLVSVIRRTLKADQRDRWDELLERDLDVPIDLATLMQIAEDLVAGTAGRPFQQPSPSGNGATTTGTSSTEDSASPEDQGLRISM